MASAVAAKKVRIILYVLCSFALVRVGYCNNPFLFFEADNLKILKTFHLAGLRTAKSQIENTTHHLKHDISVRAFLGRHRGLLHVIDSMSEEAEIDAALTIEMIDNLLNGTSFDTRSKKAILALGRILHWATGVSGPDQVASFQAALSEMKNTLLSQTKYNSQLIQGQKYLSTVSNRTNHLIGSLSNRISDNIKRIQRNKERQFVTINLLSLTTCLNVLNKNARETCNRMEKIIALGTLGYLSSSAITRAELSDMITEIKSHKRAYPPIFDVNEVHHYYTYKLTKIALSSDNLFVSLHVPLVNYEDRSVLRMLTREEKLMARNDIFNMQFIATNKEKGTYTYLTESDVMGMLKIGHNYLYTERRTEMISVERTCSELLPCEPRLGDFVVHPLSETTFVVRISHPLQVSLKCHGNTNWTSTTHTIFHINSSAIITVPPICRMESTYFTIYSCPPARAMIAKDVTFSIQYDHPILISLSNGTTENTTSVQQMLQKNKADLKKLGVLHAKLKEKNHNMSKMVDHVKIGVASGGGSLILVLILAAVCIICCCCANKNTLRLPFS